MFFMASPDWAGDLPSKARPAGAHSIVFLALIDRVWGRDATTPFTMVDADLVELSPYFYFVGALKPALYSYLTDFHPHNFGLVGEICGSPIRCNGHRKLGSHSPRTQCGIARLQLFLFVANCLRTSLSSPVNYASGRIWSFEQHIAAFVPATVGGPSPMS